MELSLSSSSLGGPALIPHCRAASSSPVTKLRTQVSNFPSKCSTKNFHQTLGLYGRSKCPKSLSNSHQWRSSIRACAQVGAAGSDSDPVLKKVSDFRDACWRFLRPHTIRGTALGSTALVARALIENPNLIKWSLLFKAFSGLFALICGNGYIVGINQIYDIGIDKVNKPYLPIAAGDLSVKSAWLLVVFFAVAGLLIVGLNFGPFITSLYSLGLFLGTIYSVPPFRMKRFPVAAFLIIATVRGFLLNFGVYYATRAALGLTFEWRNKGIQMLVVDHASTKCVSQIFSNVITQSRDITPLVLSAAQHSSCDIFSFEHNHLYRFQISTFATKLGVRNIAYLGSGLLLLNYIGAIAATIYMPQAFKRNLMLPIHAVLALCLIFQTWVLEQANYTKEAIAGFYRFIWNLFYVEYIIFPFI
ncbi:Prenyltransferase [Trema orientale]|uniref:Prenyltransferase n=1 Tax=Trema orientale TaxID=63057 RepID=A0A2P5EA71_TREOI|nr:Prenyltransferase [Trema orientale]